MNITSANAQIVRVRLHRNMTDHQAIKRTTAEHAAQSCCTAHHGRSRNCFLCKTIRKPAIASSLAAAAWSIFH
jgi:hypothetical protein